MFFVFFFFLRMSQEIVLPKVSTYEQARNKAFELLGSFGCSIPYVCTLGASKACGKIVGRQSPDKKKSWRLDYDPKKGVHINVADYSQGKRGSGGKNYAIPFNGNEKTFLTLIEHLNR